MQWMETSPSNFPAGTQNGAALHWPSGMKFNF
jgi:hypothetical protein